MMNMIQIITPEFQTICLAGLLLLSFVLPLMAGGLESRGDSRCRTGKRIAWAGQLLMAVCGSLILIFPQISIAWLAAAVVITVMFGRKLRRLGAT